MRTPKRTDPGSGSRTGPLTGRGALSNPAGRFEKRETEAVDDGWYTEGEAASIATQVSPDRARAVISRNDSPDIPFEQSINPYRGCEHGCVYCAEGSTPILMADGTLRALADLRVGDAIIGTQRRGLGRRTVSTTVLAHWSVVKPALRVRLRDGTQLVTGGDHRFLTPQGWRFVSAAPPGAAARQALTPATAARRGSRLMGTGAFAPAPVKDLDYGRGYVCGLVRGGGRTGRAPAGGREALQRAALCLHQWRQRYWGAYAAAAAGGAQLAGCALPHEALMAELISWPAAASASWSAGFLAGSFDAQGTVADGVLRIASADPQILERICGGLRLLQLPHRYEHPGWRQPASAVRLLGGLREQLRFLHSVEPASLAQRAGHAIAGHGVTSGPHLEVVAVEPLGKALRLYDITTGTGDFIANGVVSHNCYARPSHAYLGLSPGIDFETRLFYKADAGAVLEDELSRPGYVCKPITIGANTDPYQPVERSLKVTRSVLEVLERTRHPVSLITKSALILRDLDLLTSLARDGLVNVAISITTLDADTKRTLEPRAASPQARLRALRELRASGVPAGVMVAPVIPAITDHEMEAILSAAAAAQALWAGYVLVRLPHEVKDLFREWLAAHFPARAAHVMALIRDMRGGRDNDPAFGSRMRGEGALAALLARRFQLACTRLGLNGRGRQVTQPTHLFRPPSRGGQLGLPF